MVGVSGRAASVGGPLLLLELGHLVLVEQVPAADGPDLGLLRGVPLFVVEPGQGVLFVVQLVVGLHGVGGHVVVTASTQPQLKLRVTK